MLLTARGRRFKHQATEAHGIGDYFAEIVDRDETYYAKEQGLYHLFRKHNFLWLRIILLTGTASYIRAGNNAHGCKVANANLEIYTVALSTEYSYNDKETLAAANPRLIIGDFDMLLPELKQSGL